MFFSIILPIYNVEKYLKECVDSIQAQTFKDFEIILVDDGSKDSSPAICDELASQDERIKVIHKPNGGQSTARNMGLEKAGMSAAIGRKEVSRNLEDRFGQQSDGWHDRRRCRCGFSGAGEVIFLSIA